MLSVALPTLSGDCLTRTVVHFRGQVLDVQTFTEYRHRALPAKCENMTQKLLTDVEGGRFPVRAATLARAQALWSAKCRVFNDNTGSMIRGKAKHKLAKACCEVLLDVLDSVLEYEILTRMNRRGYSTHARCAQF